MDSKEYVTKKKTIENFLRLVLDEYHIDQLVNLVIWMHQSADKDEIAFFSSWCDLGDGVEYLIRDFEVDIDDLLDDVMSEKRRLADEAAGEEYERFLSLHR